MAARVRSTTSKNTAVILGFIFLMAAPCALASVPNSQGKVVIQRLADLFVRWTSGANRAATFSEAAKYIDYKGMAEGALTPAQWNKMSADEKSRYTTAFRRLIEQRYYKRWNKIFQRSKLVFAGESRSEKDTYVKTLLVNKRGEDDTVIWRLQSRNGQPMLISLDVNGKDLLQRVGSRFQKQYDKSGANSLIQWIANKARAGDASEVE
jgi:ABC-type transporter MlaC component